MMTFSINDVETFFHFGPGVCIKQMALPAKHFAVTHKHTYDHLAVLTEGVAIVTLDEHVTQYQGLSVITIKAGVAHKIEALTNIKWLCVHATDETDESKLDAVLIAQGE
jgi:quercetin dioxygenase-like cupin family protein